MLIFVGPDQSGKTTIANKFAELEYHHFDSHSSYDDYITKLVNLSMLDSVLDRHAFCEFPYSIVLNRKFQFTRKEWDNMILLTLIQNPAIVLFTHKPTPEEYREEHHLPYNKWGECLAAYRRLFQLNQISYFEYDYAKDSEYESVLSIIDSRYRESMEWWIPMWLSGIGCVGSQHPDILLVAERIGPNNSNYIPFETGPTGYMLSEVLSKTSTPLGKIAITNMVKDERRSTRKPNSQDLDYLDIEINHLTPKKVIFMGSVAKAGIEVVKRHNIQYSTIVHLGALNHKGIKDLTGYCELWETAMVPKKTDNML